MRGEVERVIEATLAGAGVGMARLREQGADVEMATCFIDVTVDGADRANTAISLELRAREVVPPG